MAHAQDRAFPDIAAVAPAAEGEHVAGFDHVQMFLERFGYLSPGRYTTGELDSATSAAIAEYQRFNSLTATGQFDEATREEMTRPRCALPDVPRGVRFVTTCRWDRAALTYVLDSGTADVAGQGEFTAVRNAFRTWQGLGVLTFREVSLSEGPDIQVDWRPADDQDLSMVGGVLAHADYPPDCGVVTNGSLPKPVHFDDSEHTWAVGAVAGAFDVETLALHEIGHIVGLAHSSVSGAIMRPGFSANFTQRTLAQDDIDGFNALYAKVPHVQELGQTVAARRVRDARLAPKFTGTGGAGAWVWRQSPQPDTILDPGSTVSMQLRTGPRP